MTVTRDKPSPYAPPTAVLDIVHQHRYRGLPTPIDADAVGLAGISESLIPRTIQALVTLDLLDKNGKPTATLEGLRLASEDEYKARLQAWLRSTYAEVFAVFDPTKDDEINIRDAFRSYKPARQQDRMVALFRGLCGAAGLGRGQDAQPARTAPRPRPLPVNRDAAQQRKFATKNATLTDLPAPIAGLLACIPDKGVGWTQEQRDKFISTFGAVLDFCIPVIERGRADFENVEIEP